MQGRQSLLRIQMSEPMRIILQKWLSRRKTLVGLARRARAMPFSGGPHLHLYCQAGWFSGMSCSQVGQAFP